MTVGDVPTRLLGNLSCPASRAVLEDYLRERGLWSVQAMRERMGMGVPRAYANADAYAYANANAYDNADANADAYAYAYANADAYAYDDANAYADAYDDANTYADANAYAYAYDDAFSLKPGGEHMKSGLYLWQQPSGNLVVLRIGWIRRAAEGGDEYEAGNVVIPKRGEYSTMPSEACNLDGPPKNWTYTRPRQGWSPLLRWHVYDPTPLDAEKWAALCPRPEGWVDRE